MWIVRRFKERPISWSRQSASLSLAADTAALAGKLLGKHFRNRDDIEISLVDKRPFHTLMTELHEVAGWRTDPDSVRVSFRKIFGARQVKAIVDLIERVDFVGGKAFSAQNQYPFDYIVIGSGAEPRLLPEFPAFGKLILTMVLR